jgi:hypothetical protein
MSGTQIAVVPTSNREKADALLARIAPQRSKAILQTADIAAKLTSAMAPAMQRFADKAGSGARALSSVEVEHRDADGSITVVKARIDLIGGK